MAQQDNKPNNETLQSMGKPDRVREHGQENQAQEFINEENNTAPASTAQGGKQPRTTQLKK